MTSGKIVENLGHREIRKSTYMGKTMQNAKKCITRGKNGGKFGASGNSKINIYGKNNAKREKVYQFR